jgi:misacylated tRNA(Ala) deacylase
MWKGLLMTDLLYQLDSYQQEFNAITTGIDIDQNALILDQTAFYPGGGGQPPDTGKLVSDNAIFQVKRARKIESNVIHIIESDHPLPSINSPLDGQIDWDRRYRLMRTHTAMHILCGVIFRDYGASVTGGSMEPLSGRMDFEFETMRKELVQEIEIAINKEVDNSRPVLVDILSRDEAFEIPDLIRTKINLLPEGIQQVRVVEIEGLDLQADGGTHVKNTSEVGKLEIVDYKSKGKINKRIYVRLVD